MKTFDDSAYRNKPGYIYLIHAKGTRRFKIGMTTRTIEARLAELNGSQSPYPLEVVKLIETGNATETERELHQKYALLRRHGEWFDFNDRQLKEVIREFDRHFLGDRRWFRFPTLSALRLPTLESLEWLLSSDTSTKGLILAGIGVVWLLVGFVGCQPSQPEPRATQVEQKLGN